MAGLENFSITSANAKAVLIVDTLFPAGIELQMFAADAAVSQDTAQIADTRMGVDGYMVAGITPQIKAVTITLEAPSPSYAFMAALWEAMESQRQLYKCTLVVTVPDIYKVFTWKRGVLREGTPFPNMAQMLEPTTWVFHFEKFTTTIIG